MPYDQIVFIGYVLDTTPKENDDGTSTYLGITPAVDDIDARCQLLAAAMETARSTLPPPASPPVKTLYVFMIPEFFFRGADPGAYDMADVQYAIAALQNLAAPARWTDWVFAFGTIIGQWELDDPLRPVQICNFALVQQGGMAAQGPSGARAIMKELKSDVDFIAADASPGGLLLGEVEHMEGAMPGPGSERQKANYDGAGIFDLLGITWATDICLDHLEARLQQSPMLPGEPMVQIQLVPSCGADVSQAGIIAQPGGYVFNVDGWRDNAAHARLVQVAPAPAQPVQMPRVGPPVPLAITDVTIGSPPRTVQVDALYPNGPGSIWTYRPVAMPPAETVPGATDTYVWQASVNPSWTFTFYLIYDDAGLFSTVLCQIRNNEIDFYANKYELPIVLYPSFSLQPNDPVQQIGTLEIELRGGGSYANAIYATIHLPSHYDTTRKVQVPPFNFEGDVMLFMNERNSIKTVRHVWA
ncbi:hypothetical protein [uncultured Sphingomonas sp.]|uniref:hypothetical protein n=1 Tax=uncultured Sphingomonas sp. TaxID=158754 RepID=UPI002636494D|nr:hypothetical protein [uncultured Sphingomonas sp.]